MLSGSTKRFAAVMSSSVAAALRAVETPLFWLGALTASWLSVCAVYRLLTGIRVWVLGNGRLVSPTTLGKWAGERRDGTGSLDGLSVPFHVPLSLSSHF